MPLRKTCAIALAVLGILSCAPYSVSSGELGTSMQPWTFKTQYAFYDVMEFDQQPNEILIVERPNDEGGEILHIRLYGFMFNPNEDRRGWSSNEWRNFRRGTETEPYLLIRVRNAEDLGDGDDVSFDSEDTNPPVTPDPQLRVDYSPGTGTLSSSSEYPKEVNWFGSHVKATLTLDKVVQEPGPMNFITGTIELEVKKTDLDDSDATTGEISVNFSAQVTGERLSECNDQTTEFGTLGGGNQSACANLDPSAQ